MTREQKFDLGDYNDVASRIAEFREKHPEGSLRAADVSRPYELISVAGEFFIAVVAAAYRTPDDPAPGIGMAWEPVPGKTPYTRQSELQNAETSAWGRAIVAALAADTRKGISSAEEVRNRRADAEAEGTKPWQGQIRKAIDALSDPNKAALKAWWPSDLPPVGRLSQTEAAQVLGQIAELIQGKEGPKDTPASDGRGGGTSATAPEPEPAVTA